jgi:signal transduction histidine kinase
MRYPAWVEELGHEKYRRLLALGVVSGYVVTACFAVLIAAGIATGVLRWHWAFAALVGSKLATNTAQLIAMKLRRRELEVGALNIVTDVVVMTGAIWLTGDLRSPLVAVYVIEISVLALLTNVETTVALGAVAVGLYVVMGVLTTRGLLPRFPTPAEWAGSESAAYLVMSSLFTAFVVAAPTVYTAGILRRLRENERRLEARTRALIDAGKQKAQFMANVTHELRTPLQGIMGLSDLVASGIYGPATERQREAMRDVKTSSKGLLHLIDDLIQLAAADAGKLDLVTSEVDLAEVLPGAVSTIRWMLGGKQLVVGVELEPSLPAMVTDRGKLNQVVLNLLSNAVKFTPDGGSLWLRARRDGAGVCIEVEDTGVGIADDQIERVFEEFYQVDGSSSRELGGTGLGLAMVRRLLDLMGGTISVTSTVGKGSTFLVRLPVRPASGIEDAGVA